MKLFIFIIMLSSGLFLSENSLLVAASQSKKSKDGLSTTVKKDFDPLAEMKAVKEDLDKILGKMDTNFKKLGDAGQKMGDSMKKLGESVDGMIKTENVVNEAHDKSLAELLHSISILLNSKLSQARPDIKDEGLENLSRIYLILTNLIFGNANIEDLDAIGRIVWHENQKNSAGYRQRPKTVVEIRNQQPEHHEREEEEFNEAYYEEEEDVDDTPLVPERPRGIGFSEFAGKIFRPISNLFSSLFGTPKTKEERRKELASEVLQKYNKLARAHPGIEEGQLNFRQDLKRMNLQQLEDINKAIDEFYTYNYDEEFYGYGDDFEEFY